MSGGGGRRGGDLPRSPPSSRGGRRLREAAPPPRGERAVGAGAAERGRGPGAGASARALGGGGSPAGLGSAWCCNKPDLGSVPACVLLKSGVRGQGSPRRAGEPRPPLAVIVVALHLLFFFS